MAQVGPAFAEIDLEQSSLRLRAGLEPHTAVSEPLIGLVKPDLPSLFKGFDGTLDLLRPLYKFLHSNRKSRSISQYSPLGKVPGVVPGGHFLLLSCLQH
jgi:hypothetical protein